MQKKSGKNSESSPGCILRFLMVLDLLGRSRSIKTCNFVIFQWYSVENQWILVQILFKTMISIEIFTKVWFFFENFCRNYVKFVYLWKISILSMDMFLMLLKFFWSNSEIFFKFWSLLAQMYSDMLIFSEFSQFRTENQHTLARSDQNLKKNLRIRPKKNLGEPETYPFSRC